MKYFRSNLLQNEKQNRVITEQLVPLIQHLKRLMMARYGETYCSIIRREEDEV
jgi:hypothetical protein